jgi:hypothetical protein
MLKVSPQLDDPKHESCLKLRIKEAAIRIIKKERKRIMYRNIGSCLSPAGTNAGGISRIDVPASQPTLDWDTIDPKTWKGPWRAVTDPEEIGFYTCKTNMKQYNQAEWTPFGCGYLANLLGDVLTSEAVDALLAGELEVDRTQVPLPETLTILNFLHHPYPQCMKQCKGEITPEQFISTYKVAQEKTSSSFSGQHVGHYKVVIDDSVLMKLHSDMMSIPYTTGFSPWRWPQVVDIMLEKDPEQPKQHRLSIVALLESDYNQSQRILVDFHMIPEMQYGSRPSKMCISCS